MSQTKEQQMKRSEGIRYLTQCADQTGTHWSGGYAYTPEQCPICGGTNDAGHLRTFSQYGATSAECAPVAWRLAYVWAREAGEPVDEDSLEHAMSLVVNDHDDVAYIIRNYGGGKYR
jgi:hypothetical protein